MTNAPILQLHPSSTDEHREPGSRWRHLLTERRPRVWFDPDLSMWVIAGSDQVRIALGDRHRFSNARTLQPAWPVAARAAEILAALDAPPVTADADAPTHPRIRAALHATFPNNPQRVRLRWAVQVGRRVADAVDRLTAQLADGRGAVDLVAEFAAVIPLQIICDVLGIPESDADDLANWSGGHADLLWGRLDETTQVRAAEGLAALWRRCRQLVADRVTAGAPTPAGHRHDRPETGPVGGEDLIAALLRYRGEDHTVLSDDEIAAIVNHLVLAGWASTTRLIAAAVAHGLTDPERWARLATDPDYARDHIEETLRYSPPIEGWLRVTTGDVRLGGVTIPAGARCLLLIGSAGHDPDLFTAPERFDPDRPNTDDHLAFGMGGHYCIGAHLARLEAFTAVTRLANRLPDLAVAAGTAPAYRHDNLAYRTLLRLPVTTGPEPGPYEPAGRCPAGHDRVPGPTAGSPR